MVCSNSIWSFILNDCSESVRSNLFGLAFFLRKQLHSEIGILGVAGASQQVRGRVPTKTTSGVLRHGVMAHPSMRPFEAFWDGQQVNRGSNKSQPPKKLRDPNHRILRPTVLTVCHLCFSPHEAHVSHETMEIDPGSLNMDLLELRNGIHSKITCFFWWIGVGHPPVWKGRIFGILLILSKGTLVKIV